MVHRPAKLATIMGERPTGPALEPSWQREVFNIEQPYKPRKGIQVAPEGHLTRVPPRGRISPHIRPLFLILSISSVSHGYGHKFVDFLERKPSHFS